MALVMVPPASAPDFLAANGWGGAAIVPLAGDASFRRYFRVVGNGRQAVLMDAPQPPHLDARADQPAEHGGDDQGRPEADIEADRVGEIGAEHVGAGMGEVEHAHHAEDEREPARQHEQQHAVDETVQEGDDEDFHCT